MKHKRKAANVRKILSDAGCFQSFMSRIMLMRTKVKCPIPDVYILSPLIPLIRIILSMIGVEVVIEEIIFIVLAKKDELVVILI